MKQSYKLVSASFGAALLAACGGANSGLSPTSSALTAGATQNAARTLQYAMPDAFKNIQIAADSCCYMAVDPTLNHIYVSSGINLSGNHTTVVDGAGSSLSILATRQWIRGGEQRGFQDAQRLASRALRWKRESVLWQHVV